LLCCATLKQTGNEIMAKLVAYDPAVIQEFASRLYRRAGSIIVSYTFLGIVLGVIAGGVLNARNAGSDSSGMIVLISFCIGAGFGFAFGQERAFKLKLEAQVALCQVQIEKNTAVR
jgi:hypothetical protein